MPTSSKAGSDESIAEKIDGITVVPGPSKDRLGERQLLDYAEHREKLIRWMLNLGKDPDHGDGYAFYTVRDRSSRLDQFYRWVWDEENRYTVSPTHAHADAYMRELAYGDSSQDNKASHMKAIKMLFRWKRWENDAEAWEPQVHFSTDSSTTNPRDYFTIEERQRLREAVLEYGSIPSYNNLSPDERDRWKIHLAQRFEKPKNSVSVADFDRANSWKIPSLVWVALDTGLRPVEVERSRVQWVDLSNSVLRIPKEESSKNKDNWTVTLTDRTTAALGRWLDERWQYGKYDESESLWLNRVGNPYRYYSLNRLLRKICDSTGIRSDGRTWYSIRHSVGTYMAREEGLAAAQAQLRHKSEQTTMRYDQAPVEDRRDALNRMG